MGILSFFEIEAFKTEKLNLEYLFNICYIKEG